MSRFRGIIMTFLICDIAREKNAISLFSFSLTKENHTILIIIIKNWQKYLLECPVWWNIYWRISCCLRTVNQPTDGGCWRHNSGYMDCLFPKVILVDVIGALTYVLCWSSYHTPRCVTVRQYKFHSSLALVLIHLLGKRNDIFLHDLSLLKLHTQKRGKVRHNDIPIVILCYKVRWYIQFQSYAVWYRLCQLSTIIVPSYLTCPEAFHPNQNITS